MWCAFAPVEILNLMIFFHKFGIYVVVVRICVLHQAMEFLEQKALVRIVTSYFVSSRVQGVLL